MNLSIAHLLWINTSKDCSLKDYYPFGMLMPQRNFSYENYKFGFNGKENDDEVKGSGNQIDYGFRVYDPRIAKFLSVDPLVKNYPWYSPYQFAGNRPIVAIDLDGLEEFYSIKGEAIGLGDENDKRKMLVLREKTANDISSMTQEQRIMALNAKPFDIVVAPDDEFINKLEEVYSKGNKIEHGFVYGLDKNGKYVFSQIYPGTEGEWNATKGIDELEQIEGVRILGVIHSHPTSYEVTRTSGGYPVDITYNATTFASDDDLFNQGERIENGMVQQSGIVIGQDHAIVADMMKPAPAIGQKPQKVASTDNVTFYGGTKSEQVKITFKQLKDAVKKIHHK